MATVNEQLLDALIRHQIGLMRLSGSIRNEIFDILDLTEDQLFQTITSRIGQSTGLLSARRIKALEEAIQKIRGGAWDEVTDVWLREMHELAVDEPRYINQAVLATSPVVLQTVFPEAARLREIVNATPFEGRTLRQWARHIRNSDIQRITAEIKIGMIQGETGPQIARRIIGTAQFKGRNGVTEITRRHANSLTRTAVNAIANQAKRAYYNANTDLFDLELYVATLDSRTTRICSSLDGKRFPVGEGPIPPLHFACRSLRVAILDGKVLGQRPTKSSTDRMLLREYTRNNGLSEVSSRGALPHGHRGAFDKFARRRVRELTGTTPAETTYQQFLKRQSVEFQDDVLGKTRGVLFRKGGLTLDKFVNRQGDELTLAQLARRDADAFRQAGLDPDNFL